IRDGHVTGVQTCALPIYNHTAEGDHRGPTLSLRGLDNPTHYILEADRSRYANYSGTGNTLNANHSIVRRMILDSLRYWVEVMHRSEERRVGKDRGAGVVW